MGREQNLTRELGVTSPKSFLFVTRIQNRDYFPKKLNRPVDLGRKFQSTEGKFAVSASF